MVEDLMRQWVESELDARTAGFERVLPVASLCPPVNVMSGYSSIAICRTTAWISAYTSIFFLAYAQNLDHNSK